MTDIVNLETRLNSALARIEAAANSGDDSGDLAAENARLRQQLTDFREERQQDLNTIDQIMAKIATMSEDENA